MYASEDLWQWLQQHNGLHAQTGISSSSSKPVWAARTTTAIPTIRSSSNMKMTGDICHVVESCGSYSSHCINTATAACYDIAGSVAGSTSTWTRGCYRSSQWICSNLRDRLTVGNSQGYRTRTSMETHTSIINNREMYNNAITRSVENHSSSHVSKRRSSRGSMNDRGDSSLNSTHSSSSIISSRRMRWRGDSSTAVSSSGSTSNNKGDSSVLLHRKIGCLRSEPNHKKTRQYSGIPSRLKRTTGRSTPSSEHSCSIGRLQPPQNKESRKVANSCTVSKHTTRAQITTFRCSVTETGTTTGETKVWVKQRICCPSKNRSSSTRISRSCSSNSCSGRSCISRSCSSNSCEGRNFCRTPFMCDDALACRRSGSGNLCSRRSIACRSSSVGSNCTSTRTSNSTSRRSSNSTSRRSSNSTSRRSSNSTNTRSSNSTNPRSSNSTSRRRSNSTSTRGSNSSHRNRSSSVSPCDGGASLDHIRSSEVVAERSTKRYWKPVRCNRVTNRGGDCSSTRSLYGGFCGLCSSTAQKRSSKRRGPGEVHPLRQRTTAALCSDCIPHAVTGSSNTQDRCMRDRSSAMSCRYRRTSVWRTSTCSTSRTDIRNRHDDGVQRKDAAAHKGYAVHTDKHMHSPLLRVALLVCCCCLLLPLFTALCSAAEGARACNCSWSSNTHSTQSNFQPRLLPVSSFPCVIRGRNSFSYAVAAVPAAGLLQGARCYEGKEQLFTASKVEVTAAATMPATAAAAARGAPPLSAPAATSAPAASASAALPPAAVADTTGRRKKAGCTAAVQHTYFPDLSVASAGVSGRCLASILPLLLLHATTKSGTSVEKQQQLQQLRDSAMSACSGKALGGGNPAISLKSIHITSQNRWLSRSLSVTRRKIEAMCSSDISGSGDGSDSPIVDILCMKGTTCTSEHCCRGYGDRGRPCCMGSSTSAGVIIETRESAGGSRRASGKSINALSSGKDSKLSGCSGTASSTKRSSMNEGRPPVGEYANEHLSTRIDCLPGSHRQILGRVFLDGRAAPLAALLLSLFCAALQSTFYAQRFAVVAALFGLAAAASTSCTARQHQGHRETQLPIQPQHPSTPVVCCGGGSAPFTSVDISVAVAGGKARDVENQASAAREVAAVVSASARRRCVAAFVTSVIPSIPPAFRRRQQKKKLVHMLQHVQQAVLRPLRRTWVAYMGVSPATRVYCTVSLVLSLLSTPGSAALLPRATVSTRGRLPFMSGGSARSSKQQALLPGELLALHPSRALQKLQLWRPFTAGMFFGPASLAAALRLYAAYLALQHMESNVVPDRRLVASAAARASAAAATAAEQKQAQKEVVATHRSNTRERRRVSRWLTTPHTATRNAAAAREGGDTPQRQDVGFTAGGVAAETKAVIGRAAIAAARSAEVLTFLLVQTVLLTGAATALRLPFFATSLAAAALYCNSMRAPKGAEAPLLFGLQIQQRLLPWANVCIDVLQAQALNAAVPGLVGICAGELYRVLTEKAGRLV